MTTTKSTTSPTIGSDSAFASPAPAAPAPASKPKVDLGDEKLKADPKESAPEKEKEKGEDKADKDDGAQQLPSIQMNAAGFYDADHAAPGDYNLPPSFGPVKPENDPEVLKKAQKQAEEQEAKEKQSK